jgi:hypothetical protein
MLGFVNLQSGVGVGLHYAFLSPEMISGILDDPSEQVLEDLPASAGRHCFMKLVDEPYQFSVMAIKIGDSNAVRLLPGKNFRDFGCHGHIDYLLFRQ